jgi:uncharacterized protein (DUF2336 family)
MTLKTSTLESLRTSLETMQGTDGGDEREQAIRRGLVKALPSLLLDPERQLSDEEREVVDAVIVRLLQEIERDVRQALADTLAARADAPRRLVHALAADEITVARPVLEASPLLDDPYLTALARTATEAHRVAMARRQHLSVQVTDALAQHGGDDCLVVALANRGATFSAPAMKRLVARSREAEALRAPLLGRAELPPTLAYRMFWWVSSELRQTIFQRFSIDQRVLDNAIAEARVRAQASLKSGGFEKRGAAGWQTFQHEGRQQVPQGAARGGPPLADIVNAARAGRVAQVLSALADRAGVNVDTVRRLAFDETGEGLAVLCRAVGASRVQFAALMVLLVARKADQPAAQPPADPSARALAFFEALTPERATRALRWWELETTPPH